MKDVKKAIPTYERIWTEPLVFVYVGGVLCIVFNKASQPILPPQHRGEALRTSLCNFIISCLHYNYIKIRESI